MRFRLVDGNGLIGACLSRQTKGDNEYNIIYCIHPSGVSHSTISSAVFRMVGGTRPVIRTSHEARRRSSVAVTTVTPDQLQYLGVMTDQHGRGSSPEIRRPSFGSDGKMTPPSPLPGSRRGSFVLQPNGSPSPARRKSAFKDGKPPLKRFDTFNMELKNSRIVVTLLIVCGCCLLVAVLSYAVKSYL